MVDSAVMHDAWVVYKLQCMSFMYDIFNNNVCVSFSPVILTNMMHGYFT